MVVKVVQRTPVAFSYPTINHTNLTPNNIRVNEVWVKNMPGLIFYNTIPCFNLMVYGLIMARKKFKCVRIIKVYLSPFRFNISNTNTEQA